MKQEIKQDKVKVELVETNFLTRWPCHVCGGCTEKDAILAEVQDGEYSGFKVCDECLRSGEIEQRMQERAERLRAEAEALLSFAHRLEVPTWREYLLKCLKHDAEMIRIMGLEREDVTAHDLSVAMAEAAAEKLVWMGGVDAIYYSEINEADVLGAYGVTKWQVAKAKRAIKRTTQDAEVQEFEDVPF